MTKDQQVKEQLLDICDVMQNEDLVEKSLFEKYDLSRLREYVRNCVFRVAVVSTFAAGKTTFINSLLGVDILGMDECAWTEAVTRVGYSPEVSIEIYFNGGKTEHFQGEYNGQKLTPQNIELIRRLILDRTTVQREGEECWVKELVVKYPFKLCRNDVEIIDTPGLGFYNDNLYEITNNILPRADAIIFLLQPDKIGERDLTRKIKEYVGNAANSKVEKGSNYIFMVMNRTDTIEPQEIIPRLKDEIHKVFDDTLKDLQVYDVSAYYALKARMVQNGYSDITYVQKDRKISVTVPNEDDFITGRAWNMDNLNLLLGSSKIVSFEKTLGTFLEGQGDAFIVNLKSTLATILKSNISQLETRKTTLMISSESAAKENNRKIEQFKSTLDNLAVNGKQTLKQNINRVFYGAASGQGLDNKIEREVSDNYDRIIDATIDDIDETWEEINESLTRYNAEDSIVNMFESVGNALDLHVKEFMKFIFVKIKVK